MNGNVKTKWRYQETRTKKAFHRSFYYWIQKHFMEAVGFSHISAVGLRNKKWFISWNEGEAKMIERLRKDNDKSKEKVYHKGNMIFSEATYLSLSLLITWIQNRQQVWISSTGRWTPYNNRLSNQKKNSKDIPKDGLDRWFTGSWKSCKEYKDESKITSDSLDLALKNMKPTMRKR